MNNLPSAPARSLGFLTARFLEKTLRKRGFAGIEIVEIWPRIVGPSLATTTVPERIAWPRHTSGGPSDGTHSSTPARRDCNGILWVRASGPAVLEVQYMRDQIIARINAHFGFTSISALRIRQAPIQWVETKHRSPIFDIPESHIASPDDPLEDAIEKLGLAIRHKAK